MKTLSQMTDREWRFAVEQQRQVIEQFEEVEAKWKKGLLSVRAELKGARQKLDRLLRGEDDGQPDDPDQPGLFDGDGAVIFDGKSAVAGERPEHEDEDEGEPTPPKRGRRGPKRVE